MRPSGICFETVIASVDSQVRGIAKCYGSATCEIDDYRQELYLTIHRAIVRNGSGIGYNDGYYLRAAGLRAKELYRASKAKKRTAAVVPINEEIDSIERYDPLTSVDVRDSLSELLKIVWEIAGRPYRTTVVELMTNLSPTDPSKVFNLRKKLRKHPEWNRINRLRSEVINAR